MFTSNFGQMKKNHEISHFIFGDIHTPNSDAGHGNGQIKIPNQPTGETSGSQTSNTQQRRAPWVMPRNPLMRASSYSPVRNAGSRADGCYSDGEGGAPFRYYETTGHRWGHGRATAGVGDGSLSIQILQNSQKWSQQFKATILSMSSPLSKPRTP